MDSSHTRARVLGDTMAAPAEPVDTICARFAAVVSRVPAAVALDDGVRRITYADLSRFASSIAARVSVAQRGRRGIAAILTEDRIAAVAAMIGVARTGQAYVSLDAGDPEARLSAIMQDSSPSVLLVDPSQEKRAGNLATGGCEVVVLADGSHDAAAVALPTPPRPESLLCLLYTSGSTGQPKGICQTHRNLLFYVDAYAKTVGIQQGDRLSLLYTLSFSAANMDIYGALLHGATLFPYVMRRDGIPKLGGWLTHHQISVVHTVPTVLRELTRTLDASQQFADIRAVDLGGEALFADDVSRFRSHVGRHCIFVNHLAAAEASVIAQDVIRSGDALPTGSLPAGRSPDGVVVRILGADGSVARPDETGRIAIDSQFLSPGYWNRPELDRVVFSELADRPGWRRFLTEDLGRIDSSGLLHFVGRSGSRIKLRGHSIDLNEVEAALLACDDVSEAAVLAIGNAGQETDRLLAFLVMAPGAAASPLVLRQDLRRRVPSYMLPSGYVFEVHLPRTATGKLDRQAMAGRLGDDAAIYRPDYEEPADDVERSVAEIFSRVLQYSPIGRLDDFFLLGGDSLSMVTLQLELRATFGRDLPDLHANGTVGQIADCIRTLGPARPDARSRVVPVRPAGTRTPLFIVHGRLGQAPVSPSFVKLFDAEQPLFGLQAKGLDGLEEPWRTVKEMAQDYVTAVRQLQPRGPYFLAALCAGAYVAIEMADRLRSDGQDVRPLLLFDPPPLSMAMSTRASQVDRRIRNRAAQGSIFVDTNSRPLMEASIRVAQSFERAIARHVMPGYQGGAFVFLSRRALSHRWTRARLSQAFPAGAEFRIVGDRHQDVLRPATREFEGHVNECLARIQSGAPPVSNLETLGDWHEQPTSRAHRWRRRIRGLLRV